MSKSHLISPLTDRGMTYWQMLHMWVSRGTFLCKLHTNLLCFQEHVKLKFWDVSVMEGAGDHTHSRHSMSVWQNAISVCCISPQEPMRESLSSIIHKLGGEACGLGHVLRWCSVVVPLLWLSVALIIYSTVIPTSCEGSIKCHSHWHSDFVEAKRPEVTYFSDT